MQALFHLYDSTQQLSKDRKRRKTQQTTCFNKDHHRTWYCRYTWLIRSCFPFQGIASLHWVCQAKPIAPALKVQVFLLLRNSHTHTHTDDPTQISIADGFGRKQPGQDFERSCEVPASAWLEGKFPWKDATPSRNNLGEEWVGISRFFLIFGHMLFSLAQGKIWKHKPWDGDLSNQICDPKMIWEVIRPTIVDQGHRWS